MRDPLADIDRPTMPATYLAQWITLMERRGVSRDELLRGTSVDPAVLEQPDARLSPVDFVRVLATSFVLAGDPALGYEFGLEMKPTTHGFLGYALLTCGTLREAIHLGERYFRVRTEAARLRFFTEGESAVLQVEENISLGPLHQFALEVVSAAILRIGEFLFRDVVREAEIWVDYPEPPYYAAWKDRLPPTRFDQRANQLRFPVAALDLPLALADPVASRAAVEQLERELALFPESDDLAHRVRALLARPSHGYPDLEAVAATLHVSARTLKRRLRQQDTSFQALLDDARKVRALVLLENAAMTVEKIAVALGYADPANFTRAFRRWTGKPPSAFR